VKNKQQNNSLPSYSQQWTLQYAGIELKKTNPYLVLYFTLRDSEQAKTYALPQEEL
jgi:hypothetical protein